MRFERMITAIDTHTGGEPTRTIIGGFPRIPGKTVSEKMIYLRDHMDWLRTMLMHEPRGHSVMSGAILTEPSDPRANIGVIYIESGGYLPMCGHDTIGCCTALVETGMVPVTEPVTEITLETPAGLVTAKVQVEGNIARSVTFTNIPAFVYLQDVKVDVPGFGSVTLDIAYGGNFYAIVEAKRFGLTIAPGNAKEIVRIGRAIKDAVNSKMTIQHPEKPFIQGLTHVEFYGPPTHPEAHAKNAVLITHDAIDRSPCGTGTSAKLAVLYSKGEISIGEEFVHESIIGTIFRARIIAETEVAGFKAVVPEITGSAYITGIHQFVVDPDDPLKDGFLLGE
ncbi:MAG TPA: proline racemase [Firmicutes bacterium]|nr:proline racemase [Candidatus Fermentithermobacillaceae bacterium]